MIRIIRSLLIVIAALPASFPLVAAEIQAGVARVDLTPPREMKAALGGYGERMSRPAEDVHDRRKSRDLFCIPTGWLGEKLNLRLVLHKERSH